MIKLMPEWKYSKEDAFYFESIKELSEALKFFTKYGKAVTVEVDSKEAEDEKVSD